MRWVSGSWTSPMRLGRAGDVEVAKADAPQAVCPAVPGQGALERPLRFAVRVDRPERRVLGDRRGIRDAVDRRGRREDDALDPDRPRGLEERHPAGDVVAVVLRRVDDRFADQRPGGAVEDGLDPLGLEEAGQDGLIRVGALVEGRLGRDGSPVAGGQVVEDDDLIAGREQRVDRDRADIAGAAGDEDACHDRTIRADARSGQVPPHRADLVGANQRRRNRRSR